MFLPTRSFLSTRSTLSRRLRTSLTATRTAWSEQAEDLEEFGFYYENTWIEKRSGRSPLFPVELWNHYQTILDDGVATNNMLESFNRTWNKLAGKSPNVWELREIMVKQEAEARRTFLKSAP